MTPAERARAIVQEYLDHCGGDENGFDFGAHEERLADQIALNLELSDEYQRALKREREALSEQLAVAETILATARRQ